MYDINTYKIKLQLYSSMYFYTFYVQNSSSFIILNLRRLTMTVTLSCHGRDTENTVTEFPTLLSMPNPPQLGLRPHSHNPILTPPLIPITSKKLHIARAGLSPICLKLNEIHQNNCQSEI